MKELSGIHSNAVRRGGKRPLAFVLALASLVLVGVYASLPHDQPFTYPIDDAYIHLSIARHLVEDGSWGVGSGFAPASSSPLWVLLLAAAFQLLGIHSVVALLFNVVFALLLALALYAFHLRSTKSARFACTLTSAQVLVLPLGTLVFLGMEHVLHALATVLFVGAWLRLGTRASSKPRDSKREILLVALLAALVVGVRFEGLMLVAASCAVAVARGRRVRDSAIVLVAAIVPIVAFAGVSLWNGAAVLPSSVLLKANMPTSDVGALEYAATWLRVILQKNELVAIVLLCAAVIRCGRRASVAALDVAWIVLGTTIAHAQFADVGFFARYEAYLIALAGLVLSVSWSDLKQCWFSARSRAVQIAGTATLVGLGGYALVPRGYETLRKLPVASANIYEQQQQMAAFVARFYEGSAIVLNDIGSVTFGCDVELVDLWGLGDPAAADAILSGRWNAAAVEARAAERGVEIAVVHERLFQSILPRSWRRVGSWRIPNNVVCADDTVTFFAVAEGSAAQLARRLHEFSSELPTGVTWEAVP